MSVIVYSKPACAPCTQVKTLLKNAGTDYEERVIGADLTREEFMERFPGVMQVPYVLVDETPIGSLQQVSAWLKETRSHV